MPFSVRYFFTASARRTDSFWLYAAVPMRSVWPMARITSYFAPWSRRVSSSSIALPSALSTALSKSNSASAEKLIFWGSSLGGASFLGWGAGLGAAFFGAGAGAALGAGGAGFLTRSGSHWATARAGVQSLVRTHSPVVALVTMFIFWSSR